jgi:hypothetical protein
MAYSYLNQSIISTLVISPNPADSFFYPLGNHTGFAADGQKYLDGEPTGDSPASWYSEAFGTYRGSSQTFPAACLVLLSEVSLVILDETTPALNLWMQALVSDGLALGGNNSGLLAGYTPSGLTYANGKLSVIYTPEAGSAIQTSLVITLDFSTDQIYSTSALPPG